MIYREIRAGKQRVLEPSIGMNQPVKRVDIVKLKMVKESSLLYKERRVKSPEDASLLFKQFLDGADREYFILTHGKKENGKPRQFKKKEFKTKQEAHKAMLELEQSLTLGTCIQPNKLLYKEYLLERFLEDKMTKVKKQTLNTYRWIVEKHIIPAIGDVELTKLNPMIIQGLYNKLTKEKVLSDENIQKVHTLINDSLKKAERWGLIARNPAALVDRSKAVKKEITVWNVEEVRQFLKYAKKSGRYYIAFLLALTTGMRQGEILGLRWKDVDFENSCVRITQTLSSDGKDLLLYTKTKSGSRTIDLPEETVTALKKHWSFIRGERKKSFL
ncbi:tyrosine recombinase XerC [Bacillus thuringiensis]|uniref:site-specific integrase n=1 Tax=Bacillus thuringiensis TaxID=1428 RepID=UPI0036EF5A43